MHAPNYLGVCGGPDYAYWYSKFSLCVMISSAILLTLYGYTKTDSMTTLVISKFYCVLGNYMISMSGIELPNYLFRQCPTHGVRTCTRRFIIWRYVSSIFITRYRSEKRRFTVLRSKYDEHYLGTNIYGFS